MVRVWTSLRQRALTLRTDGNYVGVTMLQCLTSHNNVVSGRELILKKGDLSINGMVTPVSMTMCSLI